MSAPSPIAGGLALAARSARALGAVALDALGGPFGLALPRTPEALTHAETIDGLLALHRPVGGAALPPVAGVRLPGVEFESSNCRNFLVELEFAGETDAEGGALPRTLYAKLPCQSLTTRVFGNAMGFWPLEVRFCQHVAHRIPIRVPRVYAAVHHGSRFVLLLENLHEIPGAQLFLNRDMAAGTTPERARRVLEGFAELHAAFWGATPDERERLLPGRFDTYRGPRGRAVTPALNRLALEPARRAAPDLVSERILETCRLALDRWDDVVAAWFDGPLTLVHGDSHLGNCFEYPTPDGPRVGLIDFQAVHWSRGMRDVQYFLINSLEPDVLEAHEDGLIRHYCDALAARGVALDFDDAFTQYRALSYQTLMVGIVPLGLGALTERNDTVLAITRRSTAAVERLDLRGWIESL